MATLEITFNTAGFLKSVDYGSEDKMDALTSDDTEECPNE